MSMQEMEIGASQINVTLSDAKEIATTLDNSMNSLIKEVANVNLTTTKISDSFINSNKISFEILGLMNDFSHDEEMKSLSCARK